MQKSVRILGKKAIPTWLLVFALVAAGAGAAAGTVLAGKVTAEVNAAVSQALLVEAPVWQSSLTSGHGAPQQVDRHTGWVSEPKRDFGAAKDDNTAFQAAAEFAQGEWVAFNLPFKNASSNNMTALMTLNVPEGLEVEVYADNTTTPKITEVVRIGLNTWKFKVDKDAEYTSTDNLVVVISADDGITPGYYTVGGDIKQIGY